MKHSNPKIEFEFVRGEQIANDAICPNGMDSKTHIKYVPESLIPLSGQIRHLSKLLQAKIEEYNRQLSRIEVSEIRRIQNDHRIAESTEREKRWDKDRKKIIRGYSGMEKKIAKTTGLTKTELKVQTLKNFLIESRNDLSEDMILNLENEIKKLEVL